MTTAEWNARARGELSAEALASYFGLLETARHSYRANVKAAIGAYHNNVRAIWQEAGKPATCEVCRVAMVAAWDRLKATLAGAGYYLDHAPANAFAMVCHWRVAHE